MMLMMISNKSKYYVTSKSDLFDESKYVSTTSFSDVRMIKQTIIGSNTGCEAINDASRLNLLSFVKKNKETSQKTPS